MIYSVNSNNQQISICGYLANNINRLTFVRVQKRCSHYLDRNPPFVRINMVATVFMFQLLICQKTQR